MHEYTVVRLRILQYLPHVRLGFSRDRYSGNLVVIFPPHLSTGINVVYISPQDNWHQIKRRIDTKLITSINKNIRIM